MNKGDIFRWHWLSTDGMFSPYHCCSCIAEFDGKRLRDTYWSSGLDGRSWTLDEAKKKISLTFIANRDDLQKDGPSAHYYYDKNDVVDLRHPNNSRHDNVYVRKGAKRSPEVMRATLLDTIDKCERTIDFAQNDIKRCRSELERIDAGETDFYMTYRE